MMTKLNLNSYRLILLFIASLVFNVCSSIYNICHADNIRGVLIAGESSPVHKVSVLEIRRIYLGLPSSPQSLIKTPLINSSNSAVYKAFLKNIMHMTEKGYQRKTVKKIFRQGARKVTNIQSTNKLVEYLKNNLNHISFMDKETADKTQGIKVVQVLW